VFVTSCVRGRGRAQDTFEVEKSVSHYWL